MRVWILKAPSLQQGHSAAQNTKSREDVRAADPASGQGDATASGLTRADAHSCAEISAREQCQLCADLIAYRAMQLTPAAVQTPRSPSSHDGRPRSNEGQKRHCAAAVLCVRTASSLQAARLVSERLGKQGPAVLPALEKWVQSAPGFAEDAECTGAGDIHGAVVAMSGLTLTAGVADLTKVSAKGSRQEPAERAPANEASRSLRALGACMRTSRTFEAAAGSEVEDVVLVLPALPDATKHACELISELTRDPISSNAADIAQGTATLAHVHLEPSCTGSARGTLVEPPQPPFRYTGSQDWFTAHVPTWQRLLYPLRDNARERGAPMRILELGCWEGRSSVWLLQNMIAPIARSAGKRAVAAGSEGAADAAAESSIAESRLVCVDHFDLLRTEAGRTRRAALARNVWLTGLGHVCEVMEDFTVPALTQLLKQGAEFDFVYVDASHTRSDVLLDATLAWRCVAEGGMVIFDDYAWPNHPRSSSEHPAEGIDAFLWAHRDELEVMHIEYQLAVKRTVPACRGFEWRDASEDALANVMAEGGAMWRGRM